MSKKLLNGFCEAKDCKYLKNGKCETVVKSLCRYSASELYKWQEGTKELNEKREMSLSDVMIKQIAEKTTTSFIGSTKKS